jgi:hypothetical protein
MAASAEAKDYVHLVIAGLLAKGGAAPETMVKNIADFERAHAGYDIAGKLRESIDFQADLIIVTIGENVPAQDARGSGRIPGERHEAARGLEGGASARRARAQLLLEKPRQGSGTPAGERGRGWQIRGHQRALRQ